MTSVATKKVGAPARRDLEVRRALAADTKAKTLGDVYFLSRSLESALDGAWSDDWKENHERLRHFQKDSNVHFMFYEDDRLSAASPIFNVHRAIDDFKDVIDWTDIAQPGLRKMFSEVARAAEEAATPAAAEANDPKGISNGPREHTPES